VTEVVGRGTIELVGDARKLKASIEDAKKSVRTLGEGQKDISKSAQRSIDRYVGKLQQQSAVLGKTRTETELYKLTLRGASNEQINAASVALRARDAYAKNAESVNALRTGFIALFAVAVTGAIAAAAAFDRIVKQTANFQDASEKIGDTAEAVASLAVAAAGGGTDIDQLVRVSARLTRGLTEVNDESKAAGAALEALGLDITAFKNLKAADQMEAVAKAMAGFEDGTQKTAVAMALFGRAGAEILPFLKELAKEGSRQNILTSEQIRLADEYADKQAILKAQIGLHAQAIVSDMLPALNEFTAALRDIAKDQEFAATASDALKGALGAAIVVFQTIAVVASDVGFVFKGVGREIGAIAAQLAALASLDFSGFTAISDAVRDDGVRARAELDKFQARVMSIGQTTASELRDNFDASTQGKRGRRLKFSGAADKSGASKAAQEANAQLAFDLAQIKRESEATIGAFANAERIMQARRAASLIDDKEYYAAKLGFIQLNSREQETALIEEIARLEREKLIGKEHIDNERKIAEAQAKLAKVRADAVASIEINSIQEAAANAKLAQSYVDATIAADAYIAAIKRRNQAEIEGIGRGAQFRDIQAGRNEIEDKLTGERQKLERDLRNRQITQETFDIYLKVAQDTYAKEIALYDQRTSAVLEKQADWTSGATEAFQNYIDQTRDVAKQTEELFTNAFKSMEDALVSFIQTGKIDFKSLADSIIADLIRIQVRKAIAGVIDGASGKGGFIATVAGLFKAAGGAQFTVGGAGGTDSQFIPIMATPGERVTVETPQQQREGRGMSVTNVFHISGPTDRRSQAQIAAAAGEGVQRAMSRNT